MAAADLMDLPYRPCVGIMLINRDALCGSGGGAEVGGRQLGPHLADAAGRDRPRRGRAAAALRELEEETGVHSVEVVAEAPGWLSYDLPDELLGVALKGRYRGQRQRWFAIASPATTPRSHHPRAATRRNSTPGAVPAAELTDLIVALQAQIYRDVVREFALTWARARRLACIGHVPLFR